MQNKKLYFSLGFAVILIGLAAFIAGRFVNGGTAVSDRASNVTPAPEIPTAPPEVSGLLDERQDNVLILQSVSFDAGAGWHLGESDAPMDSSNGPKVEVVVTSVTKVYRDDFQFTPDSIQQTVEETTLDSIDAQKLITVWGRKSGERIIADILLIQHLK